MKRGEREREREAERSLLRIQCHSCLHFFFFSPRYCRKTLGGPTSGLPGCCRTAAAAAAVSNTKWPSAVGLVRPVAQHHHRPSARVVNCSVTATLVLAVFGVVRSYPATRIPNKNDLDHVSRWASKVDDAAQTPTIGSAGRQNRPLGRQCSHW